MTPRSLTKAQQRVVTGLTWRRAGVTAWLLFVWATLTWLLFLFPYSRATHGKYGTAYGILRWLDVPDKGTTAISIGATAWTVLIFGALTTFIVMWGYRSFRNLTPRWECQNCGFIVSGGFPRSNLCPECGELPNLRREPWAFWR